MSQVLELRREPLSHLIPALPAAAPVAAGSPETPVALMGERLTLPAFRQLAGNLAGYPFVKVVVDVRGPKPAVHFLNHQAYPFHADYIADHLLKIGRAELESRIDEFNRSFYLAPERSFYLGIVALHTRAGAEKFFTLETVEIDNMDAAMVQSFYATVQAHLEPTFPLLFKPANHIQESIASALDPAALPRVLSHELFANAQYLALNPGTAQGRIRAFRSEEEYRAAFLTLEWYDILVMHRVPDDVPRVSGIINAHPTTPLSHTNVLAAGWRIPNCIELGVLDRIDREALNGKWVRYTVDTSSVQAKLERIEAPAQPPRAPGWRMTRIELEEPETVNTPIVGLERLRMSDRYKYGTKAANLGELAHLLEQGSERLTGFYRVRRPPRANLMAHLAQLLGLPPETEPHVLSRAANAFLKKSIQIPRGIAIPFSVQQEFLESSPRIQQAIGKLKMALELSAPEVDSLCLRLQSLIRGHRLSQGLRNRIDLEIASQLGGVSSFVVRSSSNAEDLEGFSAAGIYESINHVTTAQNIFESIKEVWASLLSPRSVRLRQDVGISLDACYMGVIVQEEVRSTAAAEAAHTQMGGVLVTTNPLSPANRGGDFRNVYINVSCRSAVEIVQGAEQPLQYLYNTVEGGGRTVSLGSHPEDLTDAQKAVLQDLAVAGRLLQSHFSPDYTFAAPVDIEWMAAEGSLYLLQLRPYAK